MVDHGTRVSAVHVGTGTPAPVWYLAEGAVGYFEEDLTIFNPQAGPVDVTTEAYTVAGAVYTRTDRIASGPGRLRLRVRDWLGVVDHGTRASAVHVGTGTPAPIVVERTMTWQADRREGHSTPGSLGALLAVVFRGGQPARLRHLPGAAEPPPGTGDGARELLAQRSVPLRSSRGNRAIGSVARANTERLGPQG